MFAGGVGLLDLGGRVAFGAGGWLVLGTSRIETGSPENDTELRVAYGGVVAEVDLPRQIHGWDLRARALVGAGNAKVADRLIRVQLGADNFGVVEPGVVGSRQIMRHTYLTGGIAYRFIFGVEDLPNVSPEDLRGASVQLGIAFRTF